MFLPVVAIASSHISLDAMGLTPMSAFYHTTMLISSFRECWLSLHNTFLTVPLPPTTNSDKLLDTY